MKGTRKHIKRARNERVRNHYKEWETDLIKWLENNIDKQKGVAITTQKQLCKEIGISNSSLNELFKKTNRIEKHTITGRRGRTILRKI